MQYLNQRKERADDPGKAEMVSAGSSKGRQRNNDDKGRSPSCKPPPLPSFLPALVFLFFSSSDLQPPTLLPSPPPFPFFPLQPFLCRPSYPPSRLSQLSSPQNLFSRWFLSIRPLLKNSFPFLLLCFYPFSFLRLLFPFAIYMGILLLKPQPSFPKLQLKELPNPFLQAATIRSCK